MFDIYGHRRSKNSRGLNLLAELSPSVEIIKNKFGELVLFDFIPMFGFDIALVVKKDDRQTYLVAIKNNIVYRYTAISFSVEQIKQVISKNFSPLFYLFHNTSVDDLRQEDSDYGNKRYDIFNYFIKDLLLLGKANDE